MSKREDAAIGTVDRILSAAGYSRRSPVIVLASFMLLFAGFQGVNAETPEPIVMHSTPTDSTPVSAATTTPSTTPAPQRGHKTQQLLKSSQTGTTLGPQADPCYTASIDGENWMDQVHGYVQDNACEPAVWFDVFFVKDHILQDLRPGALITLRNSARFIEGGTLVYVHDFHLEWRLPQWETYLKKWKLYVQSRSDENRYTRQPGQPVEPGVDRETGIRRTTIGLRADLYTRVRELVSIESGAKIGIHPDAFIRMRYQYVRPFSDVYLLRFSEIAMWQTIEHFTNTTQLDLERKISTFTLVRWGNNATYVEGKPGVTWNTGVSLLTQLTPKSAISYDTSMWGVNYPHWDTQNFRIGSLYRRNFYRPWLFFELAPEVTWPRGPGGHRNSTYAFMTTLEIQFGR